MKYDLVGRFNTQSRTIDDLLLTQESLHQSWMDLDDSIRQLDEVQQIMDNIDFAVNAVTKYGADAIKVINIDGSLESLLGISEASITVDKALEGLGNALKEGWEKFKEWCRKIWNWITEFFTNNSKRNKELQNQINELKSRMSKVESNTDLNKILDRGVNVKFDVSKKGIQDLENIIIANINHAIDYISKESDYIDKLCNLKDPSDIDKAIDEHNDHAPDCNINDLEGINSKMANNAIMMKTWREHGYNSGSEVIVSLKRISDLVDLIESERRTSDLSVAMAHLSNNSYYSKAFDKNSKMCAETERYFKMSLRIEKAIAGIVSRLTSMLSILNANLIRALGAKPEQLI